MGFGKTHQDALSIVDTHVEQKEDVTLRDSRLTHGSGWWEKFLKNPSLSLRSGDSTAGVRMDATNEQNYFKEVFNESDFWNHPEAIYNLDEIGVPLEPCPPDVVAQKVCYQTSVQKQQITVWLCKCYWAVYPSLHNFCSKEIEPLVV